MTKLEKYLLKQSQSDLYAHLKTKGVVGKKYWREIKEKESKKNEYINKLNNIDVDFSYNNIGNKEGNTFLSTQINYNG